MLQATRTQVRWLLKSWGARGSFLILFGLVMYQFFHNVLEYQGYDVIGMIHPMRLLSLSFDQINSNASRLLILINWTPLLICLSAGLSLAADQNTGMELPQLCRLGPRSFLASRLLAVFITTAVVFALPFLMELLLNCMAFPLKAEGTLSFRSQYDQELIQEQRYYGFGAVYRLSPYLYASLKILLFGAFAGLLATATAALSAVIRVRFRVSLMLPVFVLLTLSNRLAAQDIQCYLYVFPFCGVPRSGAVPYLFTAALIGFIAVFWWLGSRKDYLK